MSVKVIEVAFSAESVSLLRTNPHTLHRLVIYLVEITFFGMQARNAADRDLYFVLNHYGFTISSS